MVIKAKPFQATTIDVAKKVFKSKNGPRRFLVADEVGLGKTVVARGLVEKIMNLARSNSSEPFTVFYVCSNLAIAAQNRNRLVSFLREEERESAIAYVDRPSLMLVSDLPENPDVRVFALTPGTALPTRRGGRRDGVVKERALIYVLAKQLMPGLVDILKERLPRRASDESFNAWCSYLENTYYVPRSNWRLLFNKFRDALRVELGVQPGQHLPPRVNDLLDRGKDLEFIAAARSALAIAALKTVRPDFVVLDEFQRFRDFIDDPDDEIDTSNKGNVSSNRVLHAIRGDGKDHAPALLLLSATPYKAYRGRYDPKISGEAGSDFFKVIGFLFGGGDNGAKATAHAQILFAKLEEELRKGTPQSPYAVSARNDLMTHLGQVMSRTERPRGHLDESAGTDLLKAPLNANDISAFKQMSNLFLKKDKTWAVPFWQSVPLPMQTLGNRYKAWKRVPKFGHTPGFALTKELRDRLATPTPDGQWAHPKLRALTRSMPTYRMALPWIAPTLPWWPLTGQWGRLAGERTIDGKLLVFSRFRATTVALAGLMSYGLESALFTDGDQSETLKKKSGYESVKKRRPLAVKATNPGLLLNFHPSPLFASLEPLARERGTASGARSAIAHQLKDLLRKKGVKVTKVKRRYPIKSWKLLAILEAKTGHWPASYKAWKAVANYDQTSPLETIAEKWHAEIDRDLPAIDTKTEFRPLVDIALSAPGVVLARALQRHWPEALEDENFEAVAGACWRGLRSYFDSPWFEQALASSSDGSYADRLRAAVVAGNLESVLDEHFWYLSVTGDGDWQEMLKTFEGALRIRDNNIVIHQNRTNAKAMRLRCHAAVPMNEARSTVRSNVDKEKEDQEEAALRPEEVRQAFNTPFWPYVLVTTSVGQEGLDFHPWCKALAHWDLCSSPVDLEQREGRITRFAGLSVRRAIGASNGDRIWSDLEDSSPWHRLAAIVDEEVTDDTGLEPWWVAQGEKIKRLILAIPGDEQTGRYSRLARERALYRLVLGMPDQADLVDLLANQEVWKDQEVEKACLNLSAFHNQRK